jgi:hypothetical protein
MQGSEASHKIEQTLLCLLEYLVGLLLAVQLMVVRLSLFLQPPEPGQFLQEVFDVQSLTHGDLLEDQQEVFGQVYYLGLPGKPL